MSILHLDKMHRLVKKGIINYRELPVDTEGYEAPRVLVKNKIWRSIGKVSIKELLSREDLCDRKIQPANRLEYYLRKMLNIFNRSK